MQVVRIHQPGGPEVMQVDELPTPEPGQGQVRIRVAAAGVNFIDCYHRSGQYKVPLPFALGREGAGTVEALGSGVTELKEGQPVAWAGVGGSYATHVLATPADVVPVPLGFDLRDAAAAMLQGMTAHYLTHSTFPLQAGHTCVIHAAAGGVGQLFCQMAKMRGATIIGTTSTEEKARMAREAGADEIILYTRQDFLAEVKRITNGAGVDVVFDSVGKDTFDRSLAALKRRGTLVLFGASSGAVPPFDVNALQNPSGARGECRCYKTDWRCEPTTPVLKPSQCMRPMWRACSTFIQRSTTTFRPPSWAVRAPSALITPNCSHSAPAPMRTASSAIAGTAGGARNTSTTSTWNGMSLKLA
jgi:NADPH2:quinone reductase